MTPSRRRISHLLRLLALLSSVSAGAVVVVSDLASANAPKEPPPLEPMAMIEPTQNGAEVKPAAEIKLTKKKPAKRKARMDFGRFEGY